MKKKSKTPCDLSYQRALKKARRYSIKDIKHLLLYKGIFTDFAQRALEQALEEKEEAAAYERSAEI